MSSRLVLYVTALVGAFLLFRAAFRWQPWHTRLHLPLFVLWSAAVGTILARAWSPAVTSGIGLVLLLLAMPVVLQNQLRPLLSAGDASILVQERQELLCMDRRGLSEAYHAATAFVKAQECNDVELDLTLDITEYPLLWLSAADQGIRQVRHMTALSPAARDGEMALIVNRARSFASNVRLPPRNGSSISHRSAPPRCSRTSSSL